MLKNRSFLKGLGSGFIVGAMLLQLMLMVRDADSRIARPGEPASPAPEPEPKLTAQLVKDKAESLNLQVYDKGIVLYDQKQLDDAVHKAVEAAKAEAAAAPSTGPKQVNVFITAGMTAVQVADYLNRSGIVADRLAFEQAIKSRQLTDNIRSGLYTFSLNEKVDDVIAKLITPP